MDGPYGRKDDLESLVYVLIFLIKGPLFNIPANGLSYGAKKSALINQKLTVSIEELTRGLPKELIKVLSYTKSLKLEEKPDYNFAKSIFSPPLQKMMLDQNIKSAFLVYDWVK